MRFAFRLVPAVVVTKAPPPRSSRDGVHRRM
jgi:hypothetical protein